MIIYHIGIKTMSKSAILLINMYLASDDYIRESWYKNLTDDEKEFIKSLDQAVEEGIKKGIEDYKRKEDKENES